MKGKLLIAILLLTPLCCVSETESSDDDDDEYRPCGTLTDKEPSMCSRFGLCHEDDVCGCIAANENDCANSEWCREQGECCLGTSNGCPVCNRC